MTLCIKCFKREKQFTIKKKKWIKKEHKHPSDTKFIVCSSCIQERLNEKTFTNLWEIDPQKLMEKRRS